MRLRLLRRPSIVNRRAHKEKRCPVYGQTEWSSPEIGHSSLVGATQNNLAKADLAYLFVLHIISVGFWK